MVLSLSTIPVTIYIYIYRAGRLLIQPRPASYSRQDEEVTDRCTLWLQANHSSENALYTAGVRSVSSLQLGSSSLQPRAYQQI